MDLQCFFSEIRISIWSRTCITESQDGLCGVRLDHTVRPTVKISSALSRFQNSPDVAMFRTPLTCISVYFKALRGRKAFVLQCLVDRLDGEQKLANGSASCNRPRASLAEHSSLKRGEQQEERGQEERGEEERDLTR